VRRSLVRYGYKVVVCRWQRDLVIAYRPEFFKPNRLTGRHYRLAHGGVEKVTPHRGTFWLTGRFLDGSEKRFHRKGKKGALLVEHRINAAFEPFIRGEGTFRRDRWRKHTVMTLRIIRRLVRRGYLVLAGGDINTPHGVSAYEGVLNERGSHFDRLGSNGDLGKPEVMSKEGSDHNRLRASVPPGDRP
jgi:hypothetical protein